MRPFTWITFTGHSPDAIGIPVHIRVGWLGHTREENEKTYTDASLADLGQAADALARLAEPRRVAAPGGVHNPRTQLAGRTLYGVPRRGTPCPPVGPELAFRVPACPRHSISPGHRRGRTVSGLPSAQSPAVQGGRGGPPRTIRAYRPAASAPIALKGEDSHGRSPRGGRAPGWGKYPEASSALINRESFWGGDK